MEIEPRVDDAEELLHCVVEIPKGSRNKYEWDEELQAITLDRFLFSLGRVPHRLRVHPAARSATTVTRSTRWSA